MTNWAPDYKYHRQRHEKVARLSPWSLGIDVAGAQDGFSWCRYLSLFRLAAKLSHVGGDVDGLAYRLQRPMNYS
jgi:hypothetical protein